MTILEAIEIVDKITYKPKSMLQASWHLHIGYLEIRILQMMRSLEYPYEEFTPIHLVCHIDELMLANFRDERDLIVFVRDQIRSMEEHEMNEWLKFEGKNVVDPHPEIKTAVVKSVDLKNKVVTLDNVPKEKALLEGQGL